MCLLGEAILRCAPPADLQSYIVDSRHSNGPFSADLTLGVAYRSLQSFEDDYKERTAELSRTNQGRPVWALFGNSFVQAPGMLGDSAQAELPGKQFYFLRRNEFMQVRVAQFRLLAQLSQKPEQALFVVLPIDLFGIAENPASLTTATASGSLARRMPSMGAGWHWMDQSRLILAAKVRSSRGELVPGFRAKDVMRPLDPLLATELNQMFREVGNIAAKAKIPVTVVYIPNREQIMGDDSSAPQEAFKTAATYGNLPFLDTTPQFRAEADRVGLLIPDGHFSARGNQVLLAAILGGLQKSGLSGGFR